MNICIQIYGYKMVYIHKDLLWWCLHSYLLMLIFEYSNFFFASFTLQTFQDVASNFLKECISIKGQFCSFMSQNRFRKVTACWIHIYSKGGWEKRLQRFQSPVNMGEHSEIFPKQQTPHSETNSFFKLQNSLEENKSFIYSQNKIKTSNYFRIYRVWYCLSTRLV